MIYLNIGSGQRPFKPPFCNYDIQEEKWRPYTEENGCIWWASCTKEVLQRHEAVDLIVLHHVIEHFGCNEADSLIEDCHKMVKPGGSLLVFVPDMRALARRYLMGMMDTQLYVTNVYGAYMGDEADRHKWGYDYHSLMQYLLKWQWRKVKLFDWRAIEGADIARDWWILGMECVK